MRELPLLPSKVPPRPRFGLRSLLLTVALFSGLFACVEQLGLAWSSMLLWSLLLVVAHVFGNNFGSHTFRSRGSQHEEVDEAAAGRARTIRMPLPRSSDILLGQSIPGGRSSLIGGIAGAIALGLGGGTFLTVFYWGRASAAGMAVWYLSCAVIGALAGFAASGLVQILSINLDCKKS